MPPAGLGTKDKVLAQQNPFPDDPVSHGITEPGSVCAGCVGPAVIPLSKTQTASHHYTSPDLINYGSRGSGHVSLYQRILLCASYKLRVEKIFTVNVKYIQRVASSCPLKVSNSRHLVKL